MARIYLLHGDICTVDADAIVNSANNDLIMGAGVSSALQRIGGPTIQAECNEIGTVPLGEAVVTGAGNLRCRWLIHAAVQPLGLWADEKSIRNALRKSLVRAEEKKVKSLALPTIGSGSGAFPIDRCCDLLLSEVRDHVAGPTSIEAVVFALLSDKLYEIFEEHFKMLLPDVPIEAPPAELPRAYPATTPINATPPVS